MNHPSFYPQAAPMGYHPFMSHPHPPPPPPSHRPLQSQDVQLVIRQEPKEALVTTDGKEKVRKPVDPPPIVQLKVTHNADPNHHFLQSPYLFVTCSLVHAKDGTPVRIQNKSALVGTLVSSLHRLKDTNNQDGGFFVFGDVSVKDIGNFRLKFSLFDYHKDTNEVYFLAEAQSESFQVVQQKDFRGLDESTYLSRAFSDQGVRLRLRKEPRASGNGRRRDYNSAFQTNPSNHERSGESQERGYYEVKEEDDLLQGKKRQRYAEFEQVSPHQSFSSGPHQPVRTPPGNAYSGHAAFSPQGMQSHSGPFSRAEFDFVPPQHMTTSNQFGNSMTTSAGYSQMPASYAPYQPNGLAGYHQGSLSGMQQGMGDSREAAANGLTSLSGQTSLPVQPHVGNLQSQFAHLAENDFSVHGVAGNIKPEMNMGSIVLGRPKSRYEESVDNQVHQLKSTKDDSGAGHHYSNAPYFGVQSQHHDDPNNL